MNFKLKGFIKSGISKDLLSYYLAKLIPGILGILIIPGILRVYGKSTYGEYSLSISVVQTISTFFAGWAGQSFMRFYSLHKKSEFFQSYYKRIVNYLLLPALIISALLLFLIGFNLHTIIITSFCTIFLTLYSFNSLKFQTLLKSRSVLSAEITRSILFFSLVFLMYYSFRTISEHHVNLILYSNLVAFIAGNALFSVLNFSSRTVKSTETERSRLTSELKTQIINYGLPLALWMIGAFLLNISDRYILKIFFDFEVVGSYSAIYDTVSRINVFLFSPIVSTIQPRLINTFNQGKKKEANVLLRRAIFYELGIFVVVFMLFIIFKRYLLENYLGIRDLNSTTLVLPILLGSFFWNLSMLVHKPLELALRTRQMLFGLIIALLLNITLNIIFIPKFGMQAAALSTLVSTLTYLLYVGKIARRSI